MVIELTAVLTALFVVLVILATAFYFNRRLPWREAPRGVLIMVYGSLVLALGIALSALLALLVGTR